MELTDVEVLEAMDHYGGAFMRALAEAARRADPWNLAKVKATWAEEWAEYAVLAQLHKEGSRG